MKKMPDSNHHFSSSCIRSRIPIGTRKGHAACGLRPVPENVPSHPRHRIKDAINTYKTRLRPLIRTANIYHIFSRPDDKVWDGIEYYDPVSRKGAVVFRPR